jgi:AcrR family transcriptional regulator
VTTQAEKRVDGRNVRGQNNRRRIVDAMVELIGRGNLSPSAEEVALAADVGLRTVFRHFDDMDTLYREISAIKKAELQSTIAAPLDGDTWLERLENLIVRRALVFEKILPYKTAADLRRHRSAFLQSAHDAFVGQQRKSLAVVLPAEIARDPMRLEALHLILSFETWRRLRTDQRLSVVRARHVMAFAARALAGDEGAPTKPALASRSKR